MQLWEMTNVILRLVRREATYEALVITGAAILLLGTCFIVSVLWLLVEWGSN